MTLQAAFSTRMNMVRRGETRSISWVEGRNYGWPIVSRGIDYTGALVTPFETYDGMQDPLVNWTPSIAPAGMAIYRGDVFPDWEGDLLVAALIAGDAGTPSGHVRRVDLEGGDVVGQTILFGELEARIRDVRVAPDGTVWLLTDDENGQLIQVTPLAGLLGRLGLSLIAGKIKGAAEHAAAPIAQPMGRAQQDRGQDQGEQGGEAQPPDHGGGQLHPPFRGRSAGWTGRHGRNRH